jgi:NAD(P)-dependent dehydrogenase (short-subunit alcohol dehydrogenase family)
MSVVGRVAIVTGAAQGIGAEYAAGFARAGAAVAVADRNAEGAETVAKSLREQGADAAAFAVDVSDEEAAKECAAAVLDRFGRIDVLVNNAAIYHGMRLEGQLDVPYEYWRTVLSVNLDGALLMTRAVVPAMRERRWGRIVNQSSAAAYLGYGGHYAVSKAALIPLTWGFARELAHLNITVNCLAPGVIDTEATRTVVPEPFLKGMLAMAAIQRIGTPSDLTGMLLFLCSDEAAWITGQVFHVDGGLVMQP